jgi:hypothetical protein
MPNGAAAKPAVLSRRHQRPAEGRNTDLRVVHLDFAVERGDLAAEHVELALDDGCAAAD